MLKLSKHLKEAQEKEMEMPEILEEFEGALEEEPETKEDTSHLPGYVIAAEPYIQEALELCDKRDSLASELSEVTEKLEKLRLILIRLDAKKHPKVKSNRSLKKLISNSDNKEKKKEKPQKQAEIAEKLIKVADSLDEQGYQKAADMVENMIMVLAKEQKKLYNTDSLVEKSDRKYPELPEEPPLTISSRYCPDHNGIQTQRIAEHTFQCPLDNKVYNYETGFKDYSGKVHKPAEIHAMEAHNVGDKMFETRDMVLSKYKK